MAASLRHPLSGLVWLAMAVIYLPILPAGAMLLAPAFSLTNWQRLLNDPQLPQAAVATRDYTVGSNDREAVFSMLHAINESAGTPYAEASPDELAAAPEEYTLPADALSHLDDVYHVVAGARIGLIVVALVAVAACAHMAVRVGRRALGGVAQAAGIAVVAVFALLAAWVVVDFNGFFAAFHSLFFANGTWTFSYDSLLITMYPPEFWIGMGAVWLAATGLLSIASIVVGALLRRKRA